MVESDSDYEEEETLVMVELHGVIDSEIFAQDSFEKFKILALDSVRPILQVENFMFSGEYEHTMGTAVFFEEEDKRVKKCDPVFCKKPSRMLKYVCKTNKKLTMKRVFISEKQAGDTGNLKTEHVDNGESLGEGASIIVSDASLTDDSHVNEEACMSDPLLLGDLSACNVDKAVPAGDSTSVDDPGNTENNEGAI
ncbi:general transcription factor 3C polypeptide 6-like [Homarus americanus]|uniref:General transcription factor 3C polypeptide 6-like n=1 Tax=Homarus americanus TaxID=6706 RepID=A0A8J5N5W4_HOMAM|nr:general transcription factor 3C polypeptide 6-like [Homarus americanus]XP_042214098.1 general transcription factor 3C polypeptide 6-like [Homarus americanus]XP_042214099.1 general transcription factor 3C polypeptide 6-like [Homarus americanus]KAG7173288.1 General transcription factor 3C polypeptide 6-like [Homarus americanus]